MEINITTVHNNEPKTRESVLMDELERTKDKLHNAERMIERAVNNYIPHLCSTCHAKDRAMECDCCGFDHWEWEGVPEDAEPPAPEADPDPKALIRKTLTEAIAAVDKRLDDVMHEFDEELETIKTKYITKTKNLNTAHDALLEMMP